jgi:hypothetical protein
MLDSNMRNDLVFIIERTPEEWKALATKIKSTPVEKPKLDLFNVKGALGKYIGSPSGALEKGVSGLAKKVGVSPETAAKLGHAAGSPGGMAVAGGIAAAGAAAAIYAGYKLYKNYISKAGVACKNNPNRRKCELEYQLKGKKSQLQAILNGHHHCKSSGCYKVLDEKANQLKRDIDIINIKISKASSKEEKSERRNNEVSKGESEES